MGRRSWDRSSTLSFMRVPEFGVLRDDGSLVPLYSLAADRPVALVFLRHLGCIFCREQVATLRDALPEENVAFVTMSNPALAGRFRRWMRSPHAFFCDPERRLYEAFGVGRAKASHFLNPHLARRAVEAYRKGFRNGLRFDDALQLGGTYVMDHDGLLLASFPANDAGDHPSPEAIRRALNAPASSSDLGFRSEPSQGLVEVGRLGHLQQLAHPEEGPKA